MSKAKKTEVVATVKKKSNKNRNNRDTYIPKSAEDVVPINELTEDEKIRGGLRQPFIEVPNFQKTPEERVRWKKVHSNKKGPVSSMPRSKRQEIEYSLNVYLKNKKKESTFKTVHTFKSKESEVYRILSTFFGYKNSEFKGAPTITKVIFKGQQISL